MFSNCQSTRRLRSTKAIGGWFTLEGRHPNHTMPTQTPGMWGGSIKASWKGGPKKRSLLRTRAWAKSLWQSTLMARVRSDGRGRESYRAVSGGLNGLFQKALETSSSIWTKHSRHHLFEIHIWCLVYIYMVCCYRQWSWPYNVSGICFCICGISLDYLCGFIYIDCMLWHAEELSSTIRAKAGRALPWSGSWQSWHSVLARYCPHIGWDVSKYVFWWWLEWG